MGIGHILRKHMIVLNPKHAWEASGCSLTSGLKEFKRTTPVLGIEFYVCCAMENQR